MRTVSHGLLPCVETLLAEIVVAGSGSSYEGPARPGGSSVSVVKVPHGWPTVWDGKTLKCACATE